MLKAVPDDSRELIQTRFRAPCDSIHTYSMKEHLQRSELYILDLGVFLLQKYKSLDCVHHHLNADMKTGNYLFSCTILVNSVFTFHTDMDGYIHNSIISVLCILRT